MPRVPKKLISDSIVDAVCEIRFDCRERRETPEVVVGFLATNAEWRSYSRNRLPAADIPEQLRISDPNLQNQASLELVAPNSSHVVRVGTSSIVTARRGGYPGWDVMAGEIRALAAHSFETLEDFVVTRVGIRYINVLVPKQHAINSVHELRVTVRVSDDELTGGLNVNYLKENDETKHTIRIASSEFVNNIRPAEGVAVVDIDSTAKLTSDLTSPESIVEWADKAHVEEKEIFFGLFEESVLAKIVEEWI